MSISLLDLTIISLTAIFGAGILFALMLKLGRRKEPIELLNNGADLAPVFLFQDEVLVDATYEAMSMITPHNQQMSDFDATLHVLTPHFPKLRETLARHESGSIQVDDENDDALCVKIDKTGLRLRLAITGPHNANLTSVTDVIEWDVRLAELAMLRELTQHTPQLIWQENKTGTLAWANHAYLAFSDGLSVKAEETQPAWPSKSIFPDLHDTAVSKVPSLRRISVMLPDKQSVGSGLVYSSERQLNKGL